MVIGFTAHCGIPISNRMADEADKTDSSKLVFLMVGVHGTV